MGFKLGYHILVLPNQVLLINSVLTNEVLLYVSEVLLLMKCLYIILIEKPVYKDHPRDQVIEVFVDRWSYVEVQ